MIQTKVFITAFKGLNFDIVPKHMIRPSGIEKRSVRKKSPQVTLKPSRRIKVTSQKLINISLNYFITQTTTPHTSWEGRDAVTFVYVIIFVITC